MRLVGDQKQGRVNERWCYEIFQLHGRKLPEDVPIDAKATFMQYGQTSFKWIAERICEVNRAVEHYLSNVNYLKSYKTNSSASCFLWKQFETGAQAMNIVYMGTLGRPFRSKKIFQRFS